MTMREKGERTRRRVLGDAHVDRSQANENAFARPFVDLITEAAWGHAWSNEHLALRERSMITVALLAGLGREDELRLHLRACANTGASAEDIQQVLMHVAIYAGVPAANTAFRIAREELGL